MFGNRIGYRVGGPAIAAVKGAVGRNLSQCPTGLVAAGTLRAVHPTLSPPNFTNPQAHKWTTWLEKCHLPQKALEKFGEQIDEEIRWFTTDEDFELSFNQREKKDSLLTKRIAERFSMPYGDLVNRFISVYTRDHGERHSLLETQRRDKIYDIFAKSEFSEEPEIEQ